jgi:hypothetical protein
MYLNMALDGDIEVEGEVKLIHNFEEASVYGDFYGSFEVQSLVTGLDVYGRVNWYISPTSTYLQGRVDLDFYSLGLTGGASSGFMVAGNADKNDIWVMSDPNNKFSVAMSQLPSTISGVYGFGSVSFGDDYGVFEGSVDLYAGVGAFANTSLGTYVPGLVLPYVLMNVGVNIYGEILWGAASAEAWVNLQYCLGAPSYFQGTAGFEVCVLWVFCGSVDLTITLDEDGFDID